jgi:hypothetical protein
VQRIRQTMERLEAQRLQPHFIASFFKAAFAHLGGKLRRREAGRYEITHVPAIIRQRDRLIGLGEPVLLRYERICFEKKLITMPGKPMAAFICPGHPLLDATIDLILERYRDLMKQGAILVDDDDPGEKLRVLFYLQHSIQDGRPGAEGNPRRIISRRLQFVELSLTEGDNPKDAGPAPYLNYRPLKAEEEALVAPVVERTLAGQDLTAQAISYAISQVVPRHLREVRQEKEPLIDKTAAAVKERLTKEIAYWDHRAEDLKAQEAAGKANARINSARARQRADELEARLSKRMAELEQERQLAALPPVAIGGALIIPGGLLARLKGERQSEPGLFARETKRVEGAAMAAVMAAEQELGYKPRDVSQENLGYDIESEAVVDGELELRFIEVKGRIAGAKTVTVTKNEILTAFNKPDDWILALVEVPPEENTPTDVAAELVRDRRTAYVTKANCQVRYVRQPFSREPDFGATSVNYDLKTLWRQGSEPI